MALEQHKMDLVDGLYQQFKPIFESSEQSMYLYLDDTHKVCNKKFASLLGYSSPQEWAKIDENFPVAFVESKSQPDLILAFQNAMQKKVGSANNIVWKTKTGEKVATSVILVPVSFDNHILALHFVSKV